MNPAGGSSEAGFLQRVLVRGDGWFTLWLTLLALLLRLYVAIAWAREPVWDGHYYHFGATRIAEGLGYSEDVLIDGVPVWKPWCHYPVGYSGLLGLVYKVFGSDLLVAPVVNAIIGAVTVLVVHRLARHWLSHWRARVAGLLCALHPGLILYTAVVMTETLSAFTLVLAGLLALLPHRPTLQGIASGALLGLGALVRPTALGAIPLLFSIFRTDDSQRSSVRRAAGVTLIAGAAAFAAILPWTLRNCRVMDGCALISTNGGWNLAIGALTETGRFKTLTADDGCRVVSGQVQQDRCWAEIGRQVILQNPKAWLGLIPDKLAHTYNHESFAVGYLAEANPALWTPERKAQGQALTTTFHHLLMAAAALSVIGWTFPPLWPLRRRFRAWRSLLSVSTWKQAVPRVVSSLDRARIVQTGLFAGVVAFILYASNSPEHPFFWLIVLTPLVPWLRLPGAPDARGVGYYAFGLILLTSATHAVFFGDDRYHITISPVLCLLAAAALRRPAERSSR